MSTKVIFNQRKSSFSSGSLFSETSVCSLASLSGSQWDFVCHYTKSLLFFQTSDRGWPACRRLGRQTSTRTKISTCLKITFVDMTYSKGWTESLPLCPLIFSWLHLIGHFRVPLGLCFKTSPSAKPFLWKWLSFAWKWTRMQNSFSYERFRT